MFTSGFHLLPWYTASLINGAVNVPLAAVTDPVVPVQNGLYLLPQDYYLMALYGGIDLPTALRLNMPSLLLPTLPYMDPISGTVAPANLPPIARFGSNGLFLNATESMSLEASRAGAAGLPAIALGWLFPKPPTPYPGAVRTVQFTSAVVTAAGAWNSGNMTITATLQAGRYAVVGMQTYGTNLAASRLIFSNQVLRPGCLAQQAQGEWNDDSMRRGALGVWGTFDNTTIPVIEHFGNGATATQTGYMDIVKVS